MNGIMKWLADEKNFDTGKRLIKKMGHSPLEIPAPNPGIFDIKRIPNGISTPAYRLQSRLYLLAGGAAWGPE